jgi:formate dehydrogenase maturation protein FdhE
MSSDEDDEAFFRMARQKSAIWEVDQYLRKSRSVRNDHHSRKTKVIDLAKLNGVDIASEDNGALTARLAEMESTISGQSLNQNY